MGEIKLLTVICGILFSLNGFTSVRFSASGSDAGREYRGGDAGDIHLSLSESASTVTVSGSVEGSRVVETMPAAGEYLYLYANGGDGGDGYDGADGRPGYDGRDGAPGEMGASGSDGRRGRDGTRHSPGGGDGEDGGRGYRGGDGFPGEDGGDGTDGGNGTDAGDGGNGGKISVSASDTSLFMFVSAQAYAGSGGSGGAAGMGGRAGRGGDGGAAGPGGPGGRGGRGGKGYNCSSTERENGCVDGRDGSDGSRGSRGWSGNRGRDGWNGRSGDNGSSGADGWNGKSGEIVFVQTDANGNPKKTYKYSDRFELSVTAFDIVDQNNDSIYEPGETFTIKNITVKNKGIMPLPASATVVFGDLEVVSNSLEALPKINGGGTYTLRGTLVAKVPASKAIGSTLKVEPDTYLRGINFGTHQKSQRLKVQYPIVISRVDSVSHVEFGATNKLKIKVANISSKNHSSIKLVHRLSGDFDYKVVSAVTTISAGKEADEVIEYSAGQQVAPYHLSTLSSSLFRGESEYAAFSNNWQVVPSYNKAADASGVLVLNHQTETGYADLVAMLQSAKLKLDIFDLRINSLNAIKTADYKDKMLFLITKEGLSAEQKSLLGPILQTEIHAAAFGQPSLVSGPGYKFRRKNVSTNYFELAEPVGTFVKAALEILPFSSKLELHKHYYIEGKDSLMSTLEDKMIFVLEQEYQLAREEFKVYSSGEPLVMDYVNYALSLDAVENFGYRARVLALQPRIDGFIKVGRAGRKLRDDFLPDVEAAYEDLLKLAESCGEIKGTYRNAEGEQWVFGYTLFRKVKAKNADESLKLKGKNNPGGPWSLEYEVEDQDYEANVEMLCDDQSNVIELKLTLPHNESVIELLKVATK